MPLKVTEGWTGDLDFICRVNGSARAWVEGDTVELILKTQSGRRIKTTGNVFAVAAAPEAIPPIGVGTVRYTPDPTDLRASEGPYLARFKVTTAGRIVFFPSGEEDPWTIYAE